MMISIETDTEGYVSLKTTINEANLNNSEKFKAELTTLLDQYHKKAVLDMSSIGYMDSSFLGALVSSLKHAIAIKTDILLVGLRPDIHNLFTLIRLDKVFKIYKTLNEAVAG
ncbi:STAS domain-containing protein [Mucilaginibacter sp. JRF]|uniref:STAS domain-containing protein n=1 Tax=Mucilaginibacter sp. JRF TaxID=2780088 RepID=UPI00187EB019|nr:STAS domain-containing protein [Mucilaginibacter sp. JRF]MBE9586355.1 STAS domain-containing protein [Mucilaginibacter sp. JRF]